MSTDNNDACELEQDGYARLAVAVQGHLDGPTLALIAAGCNDDVDDLDEALRHLRSCDYCKARSEHLAAAVARTNKAMEPIVAQLLVQPWPRREPVWAGIGRWSPTPRTRLTLPDSSGRRTVFPAMRGGWATAYVFAAAIVPVSVLLPMLLVRQRQLASEREDAAMQLQSTITEKRQLAEQQSRLTVRADQTAEQLAALQAKLLQSSAQHVPTSPKSSTGVGTGVFQTADGAFAFAVRIPNSDLPWVRQAARGIASVSDLITGFNLPSAYAGASETAVPKTVTLLSPVNTRILTNRPQFRWRPVGQGNYYRLNIQSSEDHSQIALVTYARSNDGKWLAVLTDAAGVQIDSHCAAFGPTWRFDMPRKLPALSRNETIRWRVEEFSSPDTTAAPVGASDWAFFQPADASAQSEYSRCMLQYAGSHWLRGAALAHLGFIDAARDELAMETDNRATAGLLLKSLPGSGNPR